MARHSRGLIPRTCQVIQQSACMSLPARLLLLMPPTVCIQFQLPPLTPQTSQLRYFRNEALQIPTFTSWRSITLSNSPALTWSFLTILTLAQMFQTAKQAEAMLLLTALTAH